MYIYEILNKGDLERTRQPRLEIESKPLIYRCPHEVFVMGGGNFF